MNNNAVLYFGTFAMITLSLIIIFFVVWASKVITRMKKRDDVFESRLNLIENTLKVQFNKIIEIITK